eukprot:6362729-Amphidinium_carterae.1
MGHGTYRPPILTRKALKRAVLALGSLFTSNVFKPTWRSACTCLLRLSRYNKNTPKEHGKWTQADGALQNNSAGHDVSGLGRWWWWWCNFGFRLAVRRFGLWALFGAGPASFER